MITGYSLLDITYLSPSQQISLTPPPAAAQHLYVHEEIEMSPGHPVCRLLYFFARIIQATP